MSNSAIVKRIQSLILDKNVSNEAVRKEIEDLGTDTLTKEEATEVLDCLKKERSSFYSEWRLEIASDYM